MAPRWSHPRLRCRPAVGTPSPSRFPRRKPSATFPSVADGTTRPRGGDTGRGPPDRLRAGADPLSHALIEELAAALLSRSPVSRETSGQRLGASGAIPPQL